MDHPSCSKQHAVLQCRKILLDQPRLMFSCLHFKVRQVPEKNELGVTKQIVKCVFSLCFILRLIHCLRRPFIIDLDSTNGTHVNGETIPASRYYELKLNDSECFGGSFLQFALSFPLTVIKFGLSAREYVLLHDAV